ncbi:hypothetical protein MYX04_03955 [Nitrospiraceae bacterium AH_259_D15_M11_P09]|nr:hypothetical protein [Nitrospiraceae bacterium AH_259_D15_M11_P09]
MKGQRIIRPQEGSERSPDVFSDVSAELLRRGARVRFRATGRSMQPTIHEGEAITVEPVAPAAVTRGDILLYRWERGVIAHRVIRIERKKGGAVTQSSVLSPHDSLILRGDASASCDCPVEPEQVLGKVVAVERAGRRIDLAGRRAKLKRTCRVWASRLVHRLHLK